MTPRVPSNYTIIMKLSNVYVRSLLLEAHRSDGHMIPAWPSWVKYVTPIQRMGITDLYKSLQKGFTLTETVGSEHYVMSTAIDQALSIMANDYPLAFAEVISDGIEHETGDIFLQLCVFGKVMYET